jgi:hypothetical protein
MNDPHKEKVPSPQSNWYSTLCPRFETAPPVLKEYDAPRSPEVGPTGVEGVEINSILTLSSGVQSETARRSVAHLALVLTAYSPPVNQNFGAVVVPTGSQPESVLSPQLKRY